MERPVYFYTWLRGRPNCHPVHTPKNIGHVEEMIKNHATMLTWSQMGGASISLPFLEDQIYEDIPANYRYHGFMNESDFNQLCLKNGITPFAVVYESQSWEIPIETNEEETAITQMNYIFNPSGKKKEYGLREFTNGRYRQLFHGKSFKDYFPEGLRNSDGEEVTDLYEECCCRDMYGRATHSRWVEVRNMPQTCRGTCRNNPVWRAYLKRTVEILIDAGVRGVQLDETETSLTSIGNGGGCFCKDCMKQFRDYLIREQRKGSLPAALQEVDLSDFDYAEYLKAHGKTYTNDPRVTPYFDLYWQYQLEAQNKYFREIVEHTRAYAKESRGEDILVSANFTNMHLLYYPSIDLVDRCTTELRRTVFRRHNWLRLAAGYSGDLPLIIAESPYDAFIPNFVKLIQQGKANDYYRIFMMEPAVHGLSMAMPYGAWMGNDTYDSFYPPYGIGEGVQDFLYENDALFSKKSRAKVLVLYSYPSYNERDFESGRGERLEYMDEEDLFSYKVRVTDEYALPFYTMTQLLIDHQIPYDVKITGDGGLVKDTLSADDLKAYDMVVAADNNIMTAQQIKVLKEFAKKGQVFVAGRLAENEAAAAGELKACANVRCADTVEELLAMLAPAYEKIRDYAWEGEDRADNVYVQKNALDGQDAYHILNYAYDGEHHCTKRQNVTLKLRQEVKEVKVLALEKETLEAAVAAGNGWTRVTVKKMPCFASVLIK